MKLKRSYIFIVCVVMFVLFTNIMTVNAVNTGFETNSLSEEAKNSFILNVDILLIDKESAKKPIVCFDVNNSNKLVAVGQNTTDRKTISVYSEEGVFQYGYTFNCSGNFAVEWDKDNLNVYFVRSNVIVSVTPDAEIVEALEVKNSIENDSYINKLLYSTERKIGDVEYSIENNMGLLNLFASSYSQVLVKDAIGAENVIYDVSSMQLANMIATVAVILVVVILAVVLITRQFIKLKHND